MADLVVEDAWARATVPGARTAAVYATLRNNGDSDLTVTGVSTDRAKMAMIHESKMQDGMMTMREKGPLLVPAHGNVVLAPGGLHIMLMGLPASLEEGARFDVEFVTSRGDRVRVPVVVGSIGQMAMP